MSELTQVIVRVVAWWVYLAVVSCLIVRSAGMKNRINTLTFFLPLLLLTFGVFVPFSAGAAGDLMKITTRSTHVVAIALMYTGILLGVAAANAALRRWVPAAGGHEVLPEVGNPRKFGVYLGVVAALCAFYLVLIWREGLHFRFWDFLAMKWDYEKYAAHRYGFATATSPLHHAAYYLFHKLPYAISPIAIVAAANWPRPSSWRAPFIVLLGLTIFQTAQKMPLIYLAATAAVSQILLKKRLVLDRAVVCRGAGLFGAIVLLVIPFLLIAQYKIPAGSAVYWSLRRVAWELERVLQLYFEVYPAIAGHLHGMSSWTVSLLAGRSEGFIPPSVYIPQVLLNIDRTSFPTIFIGEAWADFGYFGVAISSLVVGFMLQAVNRWYYSRAVRTLDEAAFFIAQVIGAYHLLSNNLLTALWHYGFVANLLIFFAVRARPERLRISRGTEDRPMPHAAQTAVRDSPARPPRQQAVGFLRRADE